ncbi:MAG: GspH/FimT family pseudopilin [Acidiferrobacterales bacterium]|nr:GspH/FimT family pseudopilin [Acidiferrobacterales bacterium]
MKNLIKKSSYNQYGLSLIELVMTTAIVAIVTGLSIPSFAELINRNRVVAHTNKIFESLYVARSFAITQQVNVHVCYMSKPNSMLCDTDRGYNSTWGENGWLVYADVNNDNEYDDEDNLIKIFQANEHTNIVFNQRGRLRFFPDGSARSAGFYICDKQQQNYRHIYLLYSGRARINQALTDKQKTICDSSAGAK